jgi:hypothetical protein
MDDESKELAELTGRSLAEGFSRAVFDRTLGPVVELNEMLRDQVRYVRFVLQVKIVKRATAFLAKEGIEPGRVPLKLLVPLLELSSLEDEADEDMMDRWAALLANAGAGDAGATVLPSFPRILAELTSADAVILDAIYAGAGPHPVASLFQVYPADVGLADNDPLFIDRCYNLERLGLVRVGWENKTIRETDPPTYEHTIARLEGTQLGASFVAACTPPRA